MPKTCVSFLGVGGSFNANALNSWKALAIQGEMDIEGYER